MLELAVICGLLVALQAWTMVDRRAERREAATERGRLISAAHDREQTLLQRIQAPEYAAVQHYNDHQELVAPPAVNPDLDEDFWVSKDDLAEAMAREEVTGGD